MGILIDSPLLAAQLSDTLHRGLSGSACEVRPAGDALEWTEGEARHASEPGAGLLQRLWIGFLSLLPIEGLL